MKLVTGIMIFSRGFCLFNVLLMWPVEMLVEKFKSSFPEHRVSAIKVLYRGLVTEPKLVVKVFNFSVFVGYPFGLLDEVIVPPFHHKGSGKDQISHLGMAERIT